MALVADTTPDFLRFFFACQYAGLIPVPFPISIHLGRTSGLCQTADSIYLRTAKPLSRWLQKGFVTFLEEAATDLDLQLIGGPETFASLEESQDASSAVLSPMSWRISSTPLAVLDGREVLKSLNLL